MSKLYFRYWVITDTHLGHDKMTESCSRPNDFSEIILRNLTMSMLPGDVLIHIGDVCIYREAYWQQRIMDHVGPNVKKWLIRGNHDKKSIPWYLDKGWDFVADRMDLNMYGLRIALSHKPLASDDSFDVNVHGHHHITGHHPEDDVNEKHKLFFIEHDYRPVLLSRLVGK